MKKLTLLMALWVLLVPSAQSLTIIRDFTGTGPSNFVGSGNWTNIIDSACRVFETAFPGGGTLVLHYRWGDVDIATHDLVSQGGIPNRETEGVITFRPNLGLPWIMDENPLDPSGYVEQSTNLGGGLINVSRVRHDIIPMCQAIDFFTEVMHETGHALGMSLMNQSFIAQSAGGSIIVSNGSYAGTIVPLDRNVNGITSHIQEFVPGILMSGAFTYCQRVMLSALDIVTLGQLSGFAETEINPNLLPVLKISRPTTVAGRPMPSIAELSWIQPLPAPAGTRYRVQMCTNLMAGNWVTVPDDATVINGVHYQLVPMDCSSAFFRLSAEPVQ